MKKKIIYLLLFISVNFSFGQKKFILVIDPGHGGRHPGAISPFSKKKEKDIVLDISLKLGQYIKKNLPGIKIIYTRTTDKYIGLKERSEMANKNKADLFLSIHCNAHSKSKKLFGAETYVMGVHKNKENLEVAKRENSVIKLEEDYSTKYQAFDETSPESLISMSLLQSAFLDNSLYFSSDLQTEFKKVGRKDNGVRQGPFYVICFNSMPSVLIECGYLTNKKEEKFLTSKKGKRKLAYAIYNAVKKYKQHFDKEKKTEEKIVSNSKNIIYYSVQLLASSKKIKKNNPIYKDFPFLMEYKEKEFYKYTVGNEETLWSAKKLRKKVIKKGYKNAFIVLFKGGKKISLQKK